MKKRTVMLVSSQKLFGESLEGLLRKAEDIRLVGPWDISEDICERIPAANPHIVVIVEDSPGNETALNLASRIMRRFPDLPVIQTGLDQSVFYVINTRAMPASKSDLLNTIRSLPPEKPGAL